MSSRISVVIPTYNRAHFLEACVASVLDQAPRPEEIIVVDDGSQDDTATLLSGLAATHSEIVQVTKENGGVSSARNAGLERATGRMVFFLDSDDRWAPGYTERVTRVLDTHPQVGVVYSRYVVQDRQGRLDRQEAEAKLARQRLLTRAGRRAGDDVYIAPAAHARAGLLDGRFGFLLSATAVYRPRLRRHVVFEEGIDFLEDVDFMVRVLAGVDSVAYVDEELVQYVLHDANTVSVSRDDTAVKVRNLEATMRVGLRLLAASESPEERELASKRMADSARLLGYLRGDAGDRRGAAEAFAWSYFLARQPRDLLRSLRERLTAVREHPR